jgi:hypothetical protein
MEFARPTTYMDKLLFVQRVLKRATYRHDPKVAMTEICEGLNELLIALVEREQGKDPKPDAPASPAQ